MTLPDKLESGNHNAMGLFGLAAGVAYVNRRGVEAIESHGQQLTERLLAGLREIPHLQIHGPNSTDRRVPVVGITIEGYDPQEIAAALDAVHHIQARAGLHCAPLIHEALGTTAGGGMVRFSPGPFTTLEEIDIAIAAVSEIASAPLLN